MAHIFKLFPRVDWTKSTFFHTARSETELTYFFCTNWETIVITIIFENKTWNITRILVKTSRDENNDHSKIEHLFFASKVIMTKYCLTSN